MGYRFYLDKKYKGGDYFLRVKFGLIVRNLVEIAGPMRGRATETNCQSSYPSRLYHVPHDQV
jgi:hypothetical protein